MLHYLSVCHTYCFPFCQWFLDMKIRLGFLLVGIKLGVTPYVAFDRRSVSSFEFYEIPLDNV
jgi:hypothetical protein